MRESAATKGRRLLTEGRLIVTVRDQRGIAASCRGDSGQVYELGWNADRGWHCNCEAFRPTCSHIQGLMLVTVINQGSASLMPGSGDRDRLVTVHEFPNRAKEAEIRTELLEAVQATPYTVEELLTLPLDVVHGLGPLVATSDRCDLALRVESIGHGLAGPGHMTTADDLHSPNGAA